MGISTEAYLRVPFTKSKLVNPDLALAGLPHTSALHFKFSGLNFLFIRYRNAHSVFYVRHSVLVALPMVGGDLCCFREKEMPACCGEP